VDQESNFDASDSVGSDFDFKSKKKTRILKRTVKKKIERCGSFMMENDQLQLVEHLRRTEPHMQVPYQVKTNVGNSLFSQFRLQS
jgi:hypothetical protein